MNLQTPIKDAGRIFSIRSAELERLNIHTLQDLLFHIPARYENLSLISKIEIVQPGETVTIQGEVLDIQNQYTRRKFTIQKAIVFDTTGSIECMWFNQPFIVKNIQKGDRVSIAGRIEGAGFNKKTLFVKDYEIINFGRETIHSGRLVPIYPETAGLTSKWIRNRIKPLLETIDTNLSEYLPKKIRKKHNLLDIYTALKTIHFPTTEEEAKAARYRLAFDELFLLQLAGIIKKREWNTAATQYIFKIEKHKEKIEKFIESLPFELTDSQNKAINDIFQDLPQNKAMNRLLQGDVGSGKTIVAAVAMYLAYLNGLQSMLMAPTEILANQHYKTISQLLEPMGVKIKLVTSTTRKKTKQNSKIRIQEKKYKNLIKNYELNADILIGTHALIYDQTELSKLGLVVVDEQQRFGVEQRAILRAKGKNPHFLTMTATPIPRTVFLTIYGDLDISVLSDMPKGRKIVKTWLVPKFKRDAAYEWIKRQIKDIRSLNAKSQKLSAISHPPSANNQVFIVCPFIEESENITTVKAAKKEFEHLKNNVFTAYNVALLHGKMKAGEKDGILKDFRNCKYDILVATPVVEVGIDIPNATIMVIEGAERFGLSQLHQLRGRVGRSDKESYCLLFTEDENDTTRQRLKAMETTHSGAKLAEIDLQIRGAGDIYGVRQHGAKWLKIASFSDFALIETTKQEAESIANEIENYKLLQERVKSTIIQRVSPD